MFVLGSARLSVIAAFAILFFTIKPQGSVNGVAKVFILRRTLNGKVGSLDVRLGVAAGPQLQTEPSESKVITVNHKLKLRDGNTTRATPSSTGVVGQSWKATFETSPFTKLDWSVLRP